MLKVICHECGWTSETALNVAGLADIVHNLGGHLVGPGDVDDDNCPECNAYESLEVVDA